MGHGTSTELARPVNVGRNMKHENVIGLGELELLGAVEGKYAFPFLVH
jgi:hypothetical protein